MNVHSKYLRVVELVDAMADMRGVRCAFVRVAQMRLYDVDIVPDVTVKVVNLFRFDVGNVKECGFVVNITVCLQTSV